MYKPSKGQSTRVEVRSLDSACNPYLAFAVLLTAGLKGIEEGYELPEEAEDDVWALTDAERRAMGIEPLPSSLSEAISLMEELRAGRRDPGRARLRLLPAQQAGQEWEDYRSQVTPFELRRYLPRALRPAPARIR